MKKEMFFSRAQLRTLREEFNKLKRVDPDSLLFNSVRRYVNHLPECQRAQLAANNIPWLSRLARGSLV